MNYKTQSGLIKALNRNSEKLSREREMNQVKSLVQSQFIAEVDRMVSELAAQASAIGATFAATREAILTTLAQSPSIHPVEADIAKSLAKLANLSDRR